MTTAERLADLDARIMDAVARWEVRTGKPFPWPTAEEVAFKRAIEQMLRLLGLATNGAGTSVFELGRNAHRSLLEETNR